jgi:DNA-binding CsgD family transcriptional regulator
MTDVISSVHEQTDEGSVVLLLREATQALGGEAAVFCSFISKDGGTDSYRFVVACNPVWCSEYQASGWWSKDPCLIYAAKHSEPVRISEIRVKTRGQKELLAEAAKYGFAAGAVFPSPSVGGRSRMGCLTLGSSKQTYLAGEGFNQVRVYGRLLSMELNEWYIAKIRQEVILSTKLTSEEIDLLAYEKRGWKSKEIARELEASPSSIDSRFQRLNTKLNAASRAEAAKIAAEYGVI